MFSTCPKRARAQSPQVLKNTVCVCRRLQKTAPPSASSKNIKNSRTATKRFGLAARFQTVLFPWSPSFPLFLLLAVQKPSDSSHSQALLEIIDKLWAELPSWPINECLHLIKTFPPPGRLAKGSAPVHGGGAKFLQAFCFAVREPRQETGNEVKGSEYSVALLSRMV